MRDDTQERGFALVTEDPAPLVLVCAWARPGCAWTERVVPEGASASHGCCPSCAEALVRETREREAAEAAARTAPDAPGGAR